VCSSDLFLSNTDIIRFFTGAGNGVLRASISSTTFDISGLTGKAAQYLNASGALGSNAATAKNHFTSYNAGSSAIANGWIAAAFGDTSGDRTVIGQGGTNAILGAHTGDLTAWAALMLSASSFKFSFDGTVAGTKMTFDSTALTVAVGLNVAGAVSGAGFSNYLSAPPAIGGTTPASGAFTSITGTSVSTTGNISTLGLLNANGGSGSLRFGGNISRFESAEQACPTTTGNYSVAHTGPRKPDIVQAVLRCKVADQGWSVGDELTFTDQIMDTGRSYETYRNATQVGLNFSGGGGSMSIRSASGVLVAPTAASWRLVFYAYWL
jgi:hypothetical protein